MKTNCMAAFILATFSTCAVPASAFDGGVVELGDEPVFHSSTMVVPGSLQINGAGTMATYEAIDSAGNHYAVFFDSQTGEVLAASDANTIVNQLTPEQLAVAQGKYADARAQGLPIILVPIAIGGGLCYLNDQITKNQFMRHCEASGGTVDVTDSGWCGFTASYYCRVPEPEEEEPPVPPPPPGSIFGFYSNGQFGLINGSNPFGSNTFDSDWFGCLSHSGCGY